MLWATESSRSSFCWLYRASSSLAANNIIGLVSVLTTWWCSYVELSLMLLEKGFAMTSAFSWQNSVSLWPASFCPPGPITPGISWLPTFAFQAPVMIRTSFLVLALESIIGLDISSQLPLLWHKWLGHRLVLLWCWMVFLGNEPRSLCWFWDGT